MANLVVETGANRRMVERLQHEETQDMGTVALLVDLLQETAVLLQDMDRPVAGQALVARKKVGPFL